MVKTTKTPDSKSRGCVGPLSKPKRLPSRDQDAVEVKHEVCDDQHWDRQKQEGHIPIDGGFCDSEDREEQDEGADEHQLEAAIGNPLFDFLTQ